MNLKENIKEGIALWTLRGLLNKGQDVVVMRSFEGNGADVHYISGYGDKFIDATTVREFVNNLNYLKGTKLDVGVYDGNNYIDTVSLRKRK